MLELNIAFIGYFLVVAVITIYAARQTRTNSDYTVGGRRLSAPVTALSAGASEMSGWLLLGLPSAAYISGLTGSLIVIGLITGAFLSWTFVAPRLRRSVEIYEVDANTLPSFFSLRTAANNPALRTITSLVIIVFFTIYVSAGFVAGAKLFVSIFDFSYQHALLIGFVVIVTYATIGGFLAVSWTDVFQATLMLLALIVVPAVALTDVQASDISMQFDIQPVSLMVLVSALAWGLGYFGIPHFLVRFIAINNPNELPKARAIAMSWMVLVCIGAIMVGLVGSMRITSIDDAERIFIELSALVLNPWIAGIVIAAILAAVMSTVDSQLIVASTSVLQDVLNRQEQPLYQNRLIVLGIACLALIFAWNPNSAVLGIVSYAWAGLGSTIGPCVLFSLFWSKTTSAGLIGALCTGSVVTVVWHHLDGGIFELYEIVPAFLLASLAIIVFGVLRPDENASTRFKSLVKYP